MPVQWTNPDSMLTLSVDRGSATPLRAQLERALREAIQGGRLQAGERLPPTRQLAAELGISRGLVVDCYAQLESEGYLATRVGSATRVAAGAGPVEPVPPEPPWVPPRLAIDFTPTIPDLSSFPRRDWIWALGEACRTAPSADLDYGHPRGNAELRGVVASYLRRVRGAVADAQRIIVCAGFAQGLALVLRVLADAGIRRIAVEEPGPAYREVVTTQAGTQAVPVPVDGDGIDVDALAATGVRAVLLTPAHQSPTGVVLAPQRRHAVLDWAREHDAVIIEDDYDAEFRYDREPISTLQGLAPDRVVLLGTVSKSLAPALRLGWIVSPPQLVTTLARAKRYDDRGCPELDQIALALLMDSGRLDRHLRRMRKAYAARRTALVRAVQAYAPDVQVTGLAAGLHAVARLPEDADETRIVARAATRSVGLRGMAHYRLDGATRPPQLVLGFGHLTENAIDQGIRVVGDLLD
jgi:GntR family transcriptional regulator/MocR family aminotransferase